MASHASHAWDGSKMASQASLVRCPEEDDMRLFINTENVQFQVSQEVKEKLDGDKKQKHDRNSGAPMWTVQVIALDSNGAEVINVTVAGEKPSVSVGQLVTPVELQALPWVQDKRHGVAFRAAELRPATTKSVKAA